MTAWSAYRVVLRLHSPLHIGNGRVSYLQRTRPYVPARTLRGALVTSMMRVNPDLLAEDRPGDPYRKISITFAQYMAFTYFYPALKNGDMWKAYFPWEDEANFRRRFLSSYAATALAYPQQSAAEGLLHETEFISPYTLDDGQPVCLMGYIFVDETHITPKRYDWKTALEHLYVGGERGYGWGKVCLEEEAHRLENTTRQLFDRIRFDPAGKRPLVSLKKKDSVLAHTETNGRKINGSIEPLVTRQWRADNPDRDRTHVGQHLAFNGVLFMPGSVATAECTFSIGKGGYWQVSKQEKSS